MRAFGGLIGGLVAAILVMMLVGFIGDLLFPMGAEMDPYDMQQIQATFGAASLGAKFMVVLSWALGALAGAVVAKKVSGADWAASTAGPFRWHSSRQASRPREKGRQRRPRIAPTPRHSVV